MKNYFKAFLFFIIALTSISVSCDKKDDTPTNCAEGLNPAPKDLPPNLAKLTGGLLEHRYWLLANDKGDSILITADSDYVLIKEDHYSCENCADCPQSVSYLKSNFYFEYFGVHYPSGFRDIKGPMYVRIDLIDMDSLVQFRSTGSDDLFWDLNTDQHEPQTDIDEIWTFKSQATIGDQLFDLVFYRNALGNLNFDRGFEWIVSASDGYVAYVETLPLRFDHPGDTLFLIEHY